MTEDNDKITQTSIQLPTQEVDLMNALYIKWSDDNSVMVPILDEQHRVIVASINSLYYFIHTGNPLDTIKPILIILEQYTEIHFRTEEAILIEANYDDLAAHIKFHRELSAKTKSIVNGSIDPSEALIFLKGWWLNHINNEDKKYSHHIVNNT